MTDYLFPYIEVRQSKRNIILTKLPFDLLTQISYASIRGRDNEPGAIQRILSSRRISSIKEFTLSGGDYPGAIVLNWISKQNPIQKNNGNISFSNIPKSAQIIDGQHRVAGIKAAVEESSSVSGLEVPVAIYENLTTQECADIFLSINTEQKTVPRSLVFDLYGLASEPVVDPAAVRARDIATFLNEENESPYFNQIKFPGAPKRKGGIAVSTAVTAIKPLVEDKGSFEQIDVYELETQKHIVLNFFMALRNKYKDEWDSSSNVFQYAAGFSGAIDFLQLRIIPYCYQKRSFKVETIEGVISLSESDLLHQQDVKGLGGKDAQRQIYQKLVEIFDPENESPSELEI